MAAQDVIEQLLALPDVTAQRRFLREHQSQLDDSWAEALKEKVIQFQRSDIQRALQTAGLVLYLSELTRNPLHRALGLRAEAQARAIGLGEYQRALELYDEAMQICQAHDDPVGHARIQVTRVYPLACLGRYAEAFEAGQWASQVLEEHAQWRSLASLTMNLAFIHGRQGQDVRALDMLDKAQDAYRQLGPEGEPFWAQAEQNRAIVLRNLGQFEASIQASQRALETMSRLGQEVEAARARQNLALTYFILGRYNEALKLYEQVRNVFWTDGRQRDAVLVELFISDCLLQLRRFADVLDKCQRVRNLFTELGTRFEVALAIFNEAVAYIGLHRYTEALVSLAEARELFESENNHVYLACTDLETAVVLYHQGCCEKSLMIAQACAAIFETYSLPVREAQAHLLAARAASALHWHEQARRLVDKALAIGESRNVPALTYQCRHLLGILVEAEGNIQQALAEYDAAIEALEQLRGRLMVEFRAGFVEDKQVVYEDVVELCLKIERPLMGLEYAERAKSRALIDLLAHRLDLSIRTRKNADRPLIEELVHLKAERDRMCRRWEGDQELQVRGWIPSGGSQQQMQRDVLVVEKRITDLWHSLLIRNADYARDAALCQVRTEPIQPYLVPGTLLLEYFAVRNALIVFGVTAEKVLAQQLSVDFGKIQHLVQLFWLNLKATPKSDSYQVANLAKNARGLLRQLYALLIAPLEDMLALHDQLIVVPHGPLHYLPFHALYDGTSFMLQRHVISYLPGASVLRYCCEAQPTTAGLATFGYSCNGRLPHAVDEARAIAALFGGQAFLEAEATPMHLKEAAADSRVLHLAAHGDFRPDNPLFSGLALAGGWLTTLDIFNLQLNASLVTLSACQTGRSVVGGGDELLGLMRAFLYAGAASLVLSLWTVEDRSTARLMQTFYQKLAQGYPKGDALRCAQLQFIHGHGSDQDVSAEAYKHPYFWAPFFLAGDANLL